MRHVVRSGQPVPTKNDSRATRPGAGTSKPFSGQRRCINGCELNTRGRINETCLTGKECSRGERTARANAAVGTVSVPTGGRSVMLDSKSCPATMLGGAAKWVLHEDSGTGPVVLSSACTADKLFEDLPAGDDVLEYASANDKIGAYSFDLSYAESP